MNATLRNITIASILSIITILVAIIAIEFGTQTSTQTIDGITYVNTTEGMQELTDVEYLRGSVINFAQPKAITPSTIIPAELPHAGIAYGDYSCIVSGVSVTQTTPCE